MRKTFYYSCGSELTITKPTKAAKTRYCPKCGALRLDYMKVFCEDCGKTITTTVMSGGRMKRCPLCAEKIAIKRSKENWKKNAKKYNKKRGLVAKPKINQKELVRDMFAEIKKRNVPEFA